MPDARVPGFRQLITYQVGNAAETLRRAAALRLRREHDLSISEARVLWMIDAMQPVRLRDIAADAGADKAQVSRIVSALVKLGLVERHSIKGDARSAQLHLTEAGRGLLAGIERSSRERDDQLRAALKPSDAEHLLENLARLASRARELVAAEEKLQPPGMR